MIRLSIVAVAGATVYGEIKDDPESWTPADVKSLIEGVGQMGEHEHKTQLEKLEQWRSQEDAQTKEAQDAFDVIAKLFSKDESDAR